MDRGFTAEGATLVLAQAAAAAATPGERQFVLLNRSRDVWPYAVALRWHEGRLAGHSGAGSVEAHGPYAQWLARLAGAIWPRPAGAFDAAALQHPEAAAWAEWWPPHALWLPGDEPRSGWLLLQDLPFTPQQQAELARWWALWQSMERAATRPDAAAWWRGGLRAAWWRRRGWQIALAVLVLLALPVRLTVRAPGELVPRDPVVLRAAVDGTVRALKVQPNQAVKAGDLLAELDDAAWASRLLVARQALATADAEWRQTSQLALNDARAKGQLAAAQGKVEERRAEVSYLEQQVQRTALIAPSDGVVLIQDPGSWPGRTVVAGEPVMRLAQPDDQAIEGWLAVGDAIDLPAAAPMRLHLASGGGGAIAGRLESYAYEAELRPDLGLGYRLRGTLEASSAARLGARGTLRIDGPRVPLAYWVLRRPLAALRETLGW